MGPFASARGSGVLRYGLIRAEWPLGAPPSLGDELLLLFSQPIAEIISGKANVSQEMVIQNKQIFDPLMPPRSLDQYPYYTNRP
jgi:hypothetical protein